MIRFLADENFNRKIVAGFIRRHPETDIVVAQDVDLTGLADEAVLEWAARESRVILTHDGRTMPQAAYERLALGQPMKGVFVIGETVSISVAIEELVMITECSVALEWEGVVAYLPL